MIKALIYKIKKNSYLFFTFKLIVLFAIIFTLDFSIGSILKYFYFRQESGLQYRTTNSIEKTKANILIFGSSRANHHYHPDIFEKQLKMSYYNVGRDGCGILYHGAVLKAVLKRYTPKMIILDFNTGEFIKDEADYDRLASLLPYYNTHPEMRAVIENKSRYEKFKLLSQIYPYNSLFFTIAIGNADYNKERKGDIKGYVPLTNVWSQPIGIENNSKEYEIDNYKIKVFETFIENCQKAKVKLYIVCSPFYVRYKHSDYSIIFAKEIAKRNQIPFIDYSNDTLFVNHQSYFADMGHLNNEGAKVFSNELLNKIKHP